MQTISFDTTVLNGFAVTIHATAERGDDSVGLDAAVSFIVTLPNGKPADFIVKRLSGVEYDDLRILAEDAFVA